MRERVGLEMIDAIKTEHNSANPTALELVDCFTRCSDCKVRAADGNQHKPSCHRAGLVTATSDYREKVSSKESFGEWFRRNDR